MKKIGLILVFLLTGCTHNQIKPENCSQESWDRCINFKLPPGACGCKVD